MAVNLGSMWVSLKADATGLISGMGKAQASISGMSSTAKIAFAAIGIGAVAALGSAVKSAVEFDASMRNVNTIVRASEKEFQQMKLDVLNLTKIIPVSASQMAEGMYFAASAGVEMGNQLEFTAQAAQTAVAGQTTLKTTIDGTTAILKAYGRDLDDITYASDLLFKMNELGQTTFDELASAIPRVASTAALAGVKEIELAAIMATLTGVTGSAAEVATGLKAALSNLLKPTADAAALFVELGIVTPPVTNELNQQSSELIKLQGEYDKTTATLQGFTDEMLGMGREQREMRLQISKIRLKANKQDRDLTEEELSRVDSLQEKIETLSIAKEELAMKSEDQQKVQKLLNKEVNIAAKNQSDLIKVQQEQVASSIMAKIETEGFASVLEDIHKTVGDDAVVMAELFGSIEGVKTMAALTGSQFVTFKEKLSEIGVDVGKGTASQMAYEEQLKSSAAQMTLFKNTISAVTTSMANGLLPVFNTLFGWFTKLSPSAQENIIIFAGITVGVIAVTAAVWALVTAFTVLSANPIILIITGIVLAVAALTFGIYKLWTNWDSIWNWIMNHKALAGIIAILFPILIPIFAIVKAIKYLQANWGSNWLKMKLGLANVWNGILSIIENGINAIIVSFTDFSKHPIIARVLEKLGITAATIPKLDLSQWKKDTSEMEADLKKFEEAKTKAGMAETAAGTVEGMSAAPAEGIFGAGFGGGTKTINQDITINTPYLDETPDEIKAAEKRVG